MGGSRHLRYAWRLLRIDDASPASCNPPFAGVDGDADVDLSDFGVLQACMPGPNDREAHLDVLRCHCFDRESDGFGDRDIDEFDLQSFLACFCGPNLEIDPGCED